MRRRWLWGAVLMAALLTGLAWWWSQRTAQPQLEPLTVQRRPVGAFLKPSAANFGMFGQASLVDFDGDGEPELLAYYQAANPRGGVVAPKLTCWMDLEGGATATAPLLALLPSDYTSSVRLLGTAQFQDGALPPLREVIAWDRRTRTIFRLRYTSGQWIAQPIAELKGERLRNAFSVDMDGDGVVGEYYLQTDTRKLAQLRVNRENRLQLHSLAPATPAPIQQVLDNSLLSAIPISSGNAPPVAMYQAIRPLPDLDGDGKPETLVSGGGATPQPPTLQFSRTQRVLKIPTQGNVLQEQIEVVELDGDAAPELLILQKSPPQTVQIQAFEVASDRLQPLGAPTQITAQVASPCWVRDLDGDGQAEVVILEAPLQASRTLRWRVFQGQGGRLQEIAQHEQRLPLPVQLGFANLSLQRGLAIEGLHTPSVSLLADLLGAPVTVLVGFPDGKGALNPAQWQLRVLRDTSPCWAGDYDGDGVDELITSGRLNGAIYVLQLRDGVWRGTQLGEGGLGAVLPVRLKGEPWLALLSTEGQVELIRAAHSSNADKP